MSSTNSTEAVIGEREFRVGDIVRWTAPNNQKVSRKIVAFTVNQRTNETMAVMENSVCFGAEDVRKGWVQ